MSQPSVIIIGAGLGGLSTGTYAQMNGYQCQIFEHARHPGGVAAEWKRHGYTIDGGIHFYMGYRPGRPDHDSYRELGLYQADQYLEITTYGRFLDPSDGRTLDITQDLDQLAATMKNISPQDAVFINKVLTGAKAFRHSNMTGSMKKPPDMNRWWDTLKMMIKMKGTLRYYSGWYLQPLGEVTKELHDPWLAHVFKHLFLPEVPVVFIMIILGALSGGNMAVRKDGSGGFAGPWKNATWIWEVRLPMDRRWKKSSLKKITPWVCACQTAKNIGPITLYRLLMDIQRFITCWKEST